MGKNNGIGHQRKRETRLTAASKSADSAVGVTRSKIFPTKFSIQPGCCASACSNDAFSSSKNTASVGSLFSCFSSCWILLIRANTVVRQAELIGLTIGFGGAGKTTGTLSAVTGWLFLEFSPEVGWCFMRIVPVSTGSSCGDFPLTMTGLLFIVLTHSSSSSFSEESALEFVACVRVAVAGFLIAVCFPLSESVNRLHEVTIFSRFL